MHSRSWATVQAGVTMAALLSASVLSCAGIVGIETLTAAQPDGGAVGLGCPETPPKEGPCDGATSCEYSCTTPQGDFTRATCSSGAWQTTTIACGQVECGASSCETPAKVCVKNGKHSSCVSNPCTTGARTVDCVCAASLCNAASPKCDGAGTAAFLVTCGVK